MVCNRSCIQIIPDHLKGGSLDNVISGQHRKSILRRGKFLSYLPVEAVVALLFDYLVVKSNDQPRWYPLGDKIAPFSFARYLA